MHMVWKSKGWVNEVFAKFWEGGCENYGGRVHLFGVLLHLLTSFAKIYPPTPPLCASMLATLDKFDNINQMIILTMVLLGGAYYITS
jgi:hypothetical protein